MSNNLIMKMNWFEILNICELFEKAELILFLNNWSTIISQRYEDGARPIIFISNGWLLMPLMGVAVLRGLPWWSSGCTCWSFGCARASLLYWTYGRGIRCLWFRSDPERTCKWMCVWRCRWTTWHTKLLWSKLLLKSRALWLMIKAWLWMDSFVFSVVSRASHPGMSQKREKDLREDMRFLLDRSGALDFARPGILLMWMMESEASVSSVYLEPMVWSDMTSDAP